MNKGLARENDRQPAVARKLALNVFILLVSIYTLTSSGNSVDVTDDGMLRYAVTQSLIERGALDLPSDIGARWGIKGCDGHYYTKYGLGQSLLAIPFFLVGKWLGNPKFFVTLLGPLVASLVCLVLFFFCLRLGYSLKTALRLSLLAGLCTQIWPESKSPFDHSIETLFSLLSVYLVYRFVQDGRRRRLLLAGACLGFAVLTRVTSVFWLIPLSAFILLTRQGTEPPLSRVQSFLRSGAVFLAGLLPFLAFILWHNAFRFGSILETGYSFWARQKGIANIGNPLRVGLMGELISPGKGVLIYCPILFISVAGLKRFFLWRKEVAVVCFSTSIFYLIFFAKYSFWHGDIAWGPRLLTFLLPFWMLSLGVLLEEDCKRQNYISLLMKTLIAISFLIQLSAVMIDMNLHYSKLLERKVIHDVDTHAYPLTLYFDLRYSPLLDRVQEIGQALRLSEIQLLSKHHPAPEGTEATPGFDFWWSHNLSQGISPPVVLLLMSPFLGEILICSFGDRHITAAFVTVTALTAKGFCLDRVATQSGSLVEPEQMLSVNILMDR
ncbi:MAG: hypothetical protein DMG06_08280 [Acidobacteria bacterium]|nr:MAG: hypothetical protein DMG06_08280 [Acidobacteriota bacterium]